MRSRKASWVGFVLHPTFETAIALAVVLLYLLWFIHGIGERTTFEKNFLATDMPLLIDSILAMPQPGNLYALYNPQRSTEYGTNYSFKFTKNTITVSAGKNDLKPVSGYYTSDPLISVEEKNLEHTDFMIVPLFVKQGNNLMIDNANKRSFAYNRNLMECSGPGFTGKLRILGSSPIEQLVLGQPWATKSAGDGVLGIKIVSSQETMIKAYINAEQSTENFAKTKRIACEIANSVLNALEELDVEVKGSAVVPINPVHTGTKDDDLVGPLGVLLEIESSEKFESIDSQQKIALAVGAGVRNA